MTENGSKGKKIVVRVAISVEKGATASLLIVYSRLDSSIDRGLVCGGRADVTVTVK